MKKCGITFSMEDYKTNITQTNIAYAFLYVDIQIKYCL